MTRIGDWNMTQWLLLSTFAGLANSVGREPGRRPKGATVNVPDELRRPLKAERMRRR